MAARQSRRIAIVSASVAVHAALLAVVALQAPRLIVPPGASLPPQGVIPILILPRVPPPAGASAGKVPSPPQEIRLHRRPQPFAVEPPPVAPLVVPNAPAPKNGPPPIGPRVVAAPTPEDTMAANARNALRGVVGCANAGALGLSKEERQKCEDQLAAGAKQADFGGLGIDAGKAAGLAAAARRREEDYKYRHAPVPVGVPTPSGGRWDSVRSPPQGSSNFGMGTSASGIGAVSGSDKPELKVPF